MCNSVETDQVRADLEPAAERRIVPSIEPFANVDNVIIVGVAWSWWVHGTAELNANAAL
jgi:hypothetical protein